MNLLRYLFGLLLSVLILTGCKEGPRGQAGQVGPKGDNGTTTDRIIQPNSQSEMGTTSGGGGGFVHKNSKRLFLDTQKKLLDLLKNASPEIFVSLGGEWNKQRVLEVFENIEIASDEIGIRNENDELLYDYGIKEGKPFLKVLKPFFDYYSIVPVKGPKGRYYFEVQTQIVLELFHEFSHLVLNHPKGDVSENEVLKIERQAEEFSEKLFTAIVSEVVVCTSEMNYDLFGVKKPNPKTEEVEGEQEQVAEHLVWILLKYSDRGAVLKVEDPDIGLQYLETISQNNFSMDELTFLRESVGLANFNGDGQAFPPAPRFDSFFNLLSENEVFWHTAIYAAEETETETRITIGRYSKGFEIGLPIAGGGLIERTMKLENAIWGSRASVDFKKSLHEIVIPKAKERSAIYHYENAPTKIMADPRLNEKKEILNSDNLLLDCRAHVKAITLPKPWKSR